MDFLAIGDTTIDDFIELENATVHCDANAENCTISLPWGDKIPFKSSTVVYGVGNAANAAVAAARLGVSAGLIAEIGADDRGQQITKHLRDERVDVSLVTPHEGIPTNYHYVLSYQSERTILIKQEAYPRTFPKDLPPPKAIYLSSLGLGSELYHDDLAAYLDAHQDLFFIFQPGTFQMRFGAARLARIYGRTDLCVVNKEEAQRILTSKEEDVKKLMEAMRKLGPKIICITDGRNGAYASDGAQSYFVPLYPDPRPPVERTGAGDAFASTVAVALTLGTSLPEALAWGPVNSMSVVQDIGAQKGLITREALLGYLERAPEYKTQSM